MYLRLLILLITIQFTYCELEAAVVLFRHGARAPWQEKYDINKQWVGKYQQLTEVGARMQYILGDTLRTRYVINQTFMPNSYNWSQIYVYSDYVNRTLQSAMYNMYGFYPPGTGPDIIDQVQVNFTYPPYNLSNQSINFTEKAALPRNYQPVPIHSDRVSRDFLLQPDNACSKYYPSAYARNESNTDEMKNLSQTFNSTFKAAAEALSLTKSDITTLQDMWNLYDFIEAQDAEQLDDPPYPIKFTSELGQNITKIALMYHEWTLYGEKNQLITFANKLFQQINAFFQAKINGTDERKMLFYSGHDSNVFALATIFNLTSYECLKNQVDVENCMQVVDFATSVILELHNNNGQYSVTVLLNGEEKKICSGNDCSWNQFKEILQTYIVSDDEFQDICGSYYLSDNRNGFWKDYWISILLGTCITVLLIVSIALCYMIQKSKFEKDQDYGKLPETYSKEKEN